MKCYRQGDVVIKQIDTLIEGELAQKKDLVLAEGEVTGHAHRIIKGKVELMVNAAKTLMFLKVLSDVAELFHEEHESIILPHGDYEIKQQREWDWFTNEVRRVAD